MSKRLDLNVASRGLQLWLKAAVIVPDDPDHNFFDRVPDPRKPGTTMPLCAVIDTGSTVTSVPLAIVEQIRRKRVLLTSRTPIRRLTFANGSEESLVRTVQLQIRLEGASRGGHVTTVRDWGDAADRGVAILNCRDVIIGMDLLRNWTLHTCPDLQQTCLSIPE